jgi:hypothetical protein
MELHKFYPSPDFIRETNSREIRWAGHVTRMECERNVYQQDNRNRNDYCGDLGIYRKAMLKWIIKNIT